MLNVADQGKGRLLTFPSRLCLSTPLLLPDGFSVCCTVFNAALFVCRLHGFRNDTLIVPLTVLMCYKYAATCSALLCLHVCERVPAYVYVGDTQRDECWMCDDGNGRKTAASVVISSHTKREKQNKEITKWKDFLYSKELPVELVSEMFFCFIHQQLSKCQVNTKQQMTVDLIERPTTMLVFVNRWVLERFLFLEIIEMTYT